MENQKPKFTWFSQEVLLIIGGYVYAVDTGGPLVHRYDLDEMCDKATVAQHILAWAGRDSSLGRKVLAHWGLWNEADTVAERRDDAINAAKVAIKTRRWIKGYHDSDGEPIPPRKDLLERLHAHGVSVEQALATLAALNSHASCEPDLRSEEDAAAYAAVFEACDAAVLAANPHSNEADIIRHYRPPPENNSAGRATRCEDSAGPADRVMDMGD